MQLGQNLKEILNLSRVISTALALVLLSACSGGEETSDDSVDDDSGVVEQRGLVAHIYQSEFERLPDFITLQPDNTQTIDDIELDFGENSRFGVVYLSQFTIDVSGGYTFSVEANSDFRLIVDETVLLQAFDKTSTSTLTSDPVQLGQGSHQLRIEFVEAAAVSTLNVRVIDDSQQANLLEGEELIFNDDHFNPNYNHVPLDIPDDGNGDGDDSGDDDSGGSDPDNGPCDNNDAPTATNSLSAEQQLNSGDFLVATNQAYRLTLQGDGNLVLRRVADGEPIWASGTNGTGATRVRMQGDGNLVIRTADGSAVWSSGTAGTGSAYLILHNDGNLAIYSTGGQRVWETATSDGTGCGVISVDPIADNFSTPSSADLFHKTNQTYAFPEVIETSFEGNGHSVSWDGRVYVVKRTQGWFAQVLRPERITKNQQGIPDFSSGAFSSRYLMLANEDAPDLQVNWLAIVIDPDAGLENPYPSNGNGEYQSDGSFETYKALVYVTSTLNGDNDQLGVKRATFIVSDAKTDNAQIHAARFDSEFARFQTAAGDDVRCIEPSATIDGRLVICQGHPANDGRIDNLVYSWNHVPGATDGWTEAKSVANLYWDEQDTMVDGIPFAIRYPLAEKPLVDATGETYLPGQLIKGAYPWISRDGSELFYQASREGVSGRRTGTSVVGRWTGWTVKHIDGPINPQRGLSRLFLSSPGAFTTMWSPFKDVANLAIPYSAPGPVYPIFGSNSHDYSEVTFNDYLDGDFVLYYGMNEQLSRDGSFQVARTNDTSGHFNNGTLVGAKFPNEYNGQDELVGRYGQAIYFPNQSYIRVNKNAGWEALSSAISVDLWLKKLSGSDQIRLFTFENALEVYLQSGNQLTVRLTDDEQFETEVVFGTVNNDQWTHIGVTFNAETKQLSAFIDGRKVSEEVVTDYSAFNTSGAVTIGLLESNGLVLMDEVKVSRVERTEQEFEFFANQKPLIQPSTQQLNRIPNHLVALTNRVNAIEGFSIEAAELGEQLFFDTLLSKNNTTSCGTCHKQELNFTDTTPIAVGLEPTDNGTRNAPMLLNRMFSNHQGWSGSALSLVEQALQPIAAEHEMNLPIAEAIARLENHSEYNSSFINVFDAAPNADNLALALASFQAIQFSPETRFDQFKSGDTNALSAAEKRGLRLFETKARCSGCHSGTNFTDETFRNTGIVDSTDIGREEITGRVRDRHLFKVPSLRGLGLTAPYMHNGSFESLAEVVDAYDQGVIVDMRADTDIKPLELTEQEKADLVAFLLTL